MVRVTPDFSWAFTTLQAKVKQVYSEERHLQTSCKEVGANSIKVVSTLKKRHAFS